MKERGEGEGVSEVGRGRGGISEGETGRETERGSDGFWDGVSEGLWFSMRVCGRGWRGGIEKEEQRNVELLRVILSSLRITYLHGSCLVQNSVEGCLDMSCCCYTLRTFRRPCCPTSRTLTAWTVSS